MSYLNDNIRHLRKERGLTQAGLAQKIGIKRSLVGAYEEHRAEPPVATMQKLSYLFQVPLDALINTDLSKDGTTPGVDTAGRTLRVLPIVVDEENKERITLVPVSAEAGYADSYGDPEYIESLPSFSLPVQELYPDQTYRLFQIHGDSMLPVCPGSYIISSYTQDWKDIKDGQCYIVVTRDRGIVYKRLWNKFDEGVLLLKSDNPAYQPYTLEAAEVIEVWKALGYLCFDLPEAQGASVSDIQQVGVMLMQLQEEVRGMKEKMEMISDKYE